MALPRKNANLGQVINVSGTALGDTISVPSSGIVNISGVLNVNGTRVSVSGHSHTSSDITNFNTSVSGLVNNIYAPLNSPTLTGVPLTPTAASGTNTNQIASTAFVRTEISNLVASAPATLDTLNELAAALGNDASFSTTVTNSLAGKANLSGASFTGTVTGPTGNFTVLQQNGTSVSTVGHSHTASNITDFNSSVSGLLPTVINSGNNRVLTSTGSTVGVSGQSNLVFTGSSLGVNTSSPSGAIHVVGTGLVSSVTGTVPNHLFHVYSATSGANIFNVEGTNGSLFSIVDSLSGSLMSVNNSAGLPVFEVFSDDRVIAGRFNQNDLVVTSGGNIGIGIGSPSSKIQVSGLLTANSGNFTNSLQVNGTGVSISGHSHSISDISTFSSSALAARVTDETGSGSLVFTSGATLFNPSVFGSINIGDGLNYTPTLIMNGDNGEFLNITQTKALLTMPIELYGAGGGTTERLLLRAQSADFLGTPGNIVGVVASGHWRAATILPDKGGTGRTSYSNGQLLIGSGTSLAANTLTAGTGINITNGSGTVTVAVTGLINNPANNRILTSRDSTTTGIDAESNLTFNGSNLIVTGDVTVDNLKLDGNTLSSTTGNIIISPSGSGAIQRDSGGNNRGQYAIDWQTVRSNPVQVASGNYSMIGGGRDNGAFGNFSSVVVGSGNSVSPPHSVVLGGSSNLIREKYSSTFGQSNTINGNFSTSLGSGNFIAGDRNHVIGRNNIVYADSNTVLGDTCQIGDGIGFNGETNGSYVIVYDSGYATGAIQSLGLSNIPVKYWELGGSASSESFFNTIIGAYYDSVMDASIIEFDSIDIAQFDTIEFMIIDTYAAYTTVFGHRARSRQHGELTHAAGSFSVPGDAQHSIFVARRTTTNATANQSLFLDGTSRTLSIPPITTWSFTITVSAYNITDNAGAWWIIRGGARRNNNNITTLIGSLITESGSDTAMSSASVSVVTTASNTLEIRVTGIASKSIRWVATIDVTQVTGV